MKTCVVLGLGSNKVYDGKNSLELLTLAVKEISSYVSGISVSSVYRSRAMYLTEQADFYNMAAAGFYEGDAQSLLDKIHATEARLGRDRSKEVRNGPRSIDIDIELFGKETIKTAELIVPHERLCERAFVLKPLLEILNENADRYKDDGGLPLLLYDTAFIRSLVNSEVIAAQEIEAVQTFPRGTLYGTDRSS